MTPPTTWAVLVTTGDDTARVVSDLKDVAYEAKITRDGALGSDAVSPAKIARIALGPLTIIAAARPAISRGSRAFIYTPVKNVSVFPPEIYSYFHKKGIPVLQKNSL